MVDGEAPHASGEGLGQAAPEAGATSQEAVARVRIVRPRVGAWRPIRSTLEWWQQIRPGETVELETSGPLIETEDLDEV